MALNNNRGMTLLEIVAAMALFASVFVYISKITRAQVRQREKMAKKNHRLPH